MYSVSKMVRYCSVTGCSNNTNNFKKCTQNEISFHPFPWDPEMKFKWLKAIGRPNWDPPSYSRICSVHFTQNAFVQFGYKTRLKDDACPALILHENSNLGANGLEVCRICLATDVKLYSLQDESTSFYTHAFSWLIRGRSINGMPQFICYICKADLLKSYRLFAKTMVAQTALQDVFAKNGEISRSLVKLIDRKSLNLTSSLKCNFATPTAMFEFRFNEMEGVSHLRSLLSAMGVRLDIDLTPAIQTPSVSNKVQNNELGFSDSDAVQNIELNLNDSDDEGNLVLVLDEHEDDKLIKNDVVDDISEELIRSQNEIYQHTFGRQVSYMGNETVTTENSNIISNMNVSMPTQKLHELAHENIDGLFLTPLEVSMKKYFDIVKLSLQEQIIEWRRGIEMRYPDSENLMRCEVCTKPYANKFPLRSHSLTHDPKRGNYECVVCKQRFKSYQLVKSHANRVHAKKFNCRSCFKSFGNVSLAKRHQLRHEGHVYRCAVCPFVTVHRTAMGAHARLCHSPRYGCCTLCGYSFASVRGLRLHRTMAHANVKDADKLETPFRCEDCQVEFVSAGALRVHFLTARQHKQERGKTNDPELRTTCRICGHTYATRDELASHWHKPVSGLPESAYPTRCDHCLVVVKNRKEHWDHVRKIHPNQKDSEYDVISEACMWCGKEFQSISQLSIHEKKHAVVQGLPGGTRGAKDTGTGTGGEPAKPVARDTSCQCACGRVLAGRSTLRRHIMRYHSSERPYACQECPRRFKLNADLQRHMKIHSGVRAFHCGFCDKKFKHSPSKNLHMRAHHYHLLPIGTADR